MQLLLLLLLSELQLALSTKVVRNRWICIVVSLERRERILRHIGVVCTEVWLLVAVFVVVVLDLAVGNILLWLILERVHLLLLPLKLLLLLNRQWLLLQLLVYVQLLILAECHGVTMLGVSTLIHWQVVASRHWQLNLVDLLLIVLIRLGLLRNGGTHIAIAIIKQDLVLCTCVCIASDADILVAHLITILCHLNWNLAHAVILLLCNASLIARPRPLLNLIGILVLIKLPRLHLILLIVHRYYYFG